MGPHSAALPTEEQVEYTTYIGSPPIAMTTRAAEVVAGNMPSTFENIFEAVSNLVQLSFGWLSATTIDIAVQVVVAVVSQGDVDANNWIMFATTPALHLLNVCLLIFLHNFWKKLIVGRLDRRRDMGIKSPRAFGKVRP